MYLLNEHWLAFTTIILASITLLLILFIEYFLNITLPILKDNNLFLWAGLCFIFFVILLYVNTLEINTNVSKIKK